MINRTPEPVSFAADLDAHLIDMPSMTAETTSRNTPFSDHTSKQRTEPVPPEAYCLVADINTPLEQQVLDIPQAQREPHLHHHHEADHLG